MSAQPHLFRLLAYIRLLANRPGSTVQQAAQTLDTTPRTVYRYLETLDELGYLIDKDGQGRYFLFEPDRTHRPAFTPDESALVVRLLGSLPPEHPLTDSIRRKLYLTSELVPLADELQERHQGMLIERLAVALREGRQVQLIRYHSANTNTIADRLVEPIAFTDNHDTLKAIDLTDAGREKSFKIRRMHDVLVLNTPCTSRPTTGEILDAFDWPGPESLLITLNLSHLAYRLLTEERRGCRPFLQPQANPDFPYRFRGEVRSYVGIGQTLENTLVEGDIVPAILEQVLYGGTFALSLSTSDPIAYQLPTRFAYKSDYGMRTVAKRRLFSFVGPRVTFQNRTFPGVKVGDVFVPLFTL